MAATALKMALAFVLLTGLSDGSYLDDLCGNPAAEKKCQEEINGSYSNCSAYFQYKVCAEAALCPASMVQDVLKDGFSVTCGTGNRNITVPTESEDIVGGPENSSEKAFPNNTQTVGFRDYSLNIPVPWIIVLSLRIVTLLAIIPFAFWYLKNRKQTKESENTDLERDGTKIDPLLPEGESSV